MTKDEELAMDLALAALEIEDLACRYLKEQTPSQIVEAITAIKQARSAPVQEPYGYWWIPDGSVSGLKPEMSPNTGPHPNFTVIPLYTTTPAAQRPWVGLTDKEIDQGLCRTPYAMKTAEAWREGVRWAYHQLKEKNT
jgi:hypothetical protein